MTLRDNIKKKVEPLLDDANQSLTKLVQRAVVDELTGLLSCDAKAYKMKRGKPNVILFVGLQGAGKTTTIAKFANYYQRRGWKTAMVCADTFRAGAFDQLKQNATKLRVPFYGSYTEADPVTIAEDGVEQFIKDRYEGKQATYGSHLTYYRVTTSFFDMLIFVQLTVLISLNSHYCGYEWSAQARKQAIGRNARVGCGGTTGQCCPCDGCDARTGGI
jgi:hypothetical protein